MASSFNQGRMPKSILKNTSKSSEEAIAARNRELAIHHALIIQRQKDAEMAIVQSIEALIEYPYKTMDPTRPNAEEIKEVKEYLSSFRPSDFDSAVEERNLDEKCGYMLCPRHRLKQNTSAKFRLLQRQSLQVVKTSDLEKWCSDDCARRALYLRIQLKESPPWDRSAANDGGLKLYGEVEVQTLNTGVDHITRDLQKLAMERGDTTNSFRAKTLQTGLQERFENMSIEEPAPPSLDDQNDGFHVEGYSSGMAKGRYRNPLDLDMIKDSDDILDSI